MKRIILTIFVALCTLTTVSAQSLYKKVYDKAVAVVNDDKASDEEIQINQFQVTVLNYITTQVKKRGLDKDSYFFDAQAVNLTSFVTDYLVNLETARGISSLKREQVIKCYVDASVKNPLFNDKDKEKVNAYVNDDQTLTPFCVDTDWEKAYDQATQQVKLIMKR